MSTQDTSPRDTTPESNPMQTAAADAAQRALQMARRLGNPLLLAALLVAGLMTWQWYSVRQQATGQQVLEKRLNAADSADQESRALLKQAQEQNEALQSRLSALESRLGEFSEQAGGLQSVYRDLATSREIAILAEVEHALTLAAQQLRSTGDLPAAILAVQAAESRLAKLDASHVANATKVLARDLDRLRKTPNPDLPAISRQLDKLAAGIDRLPLTQDTRATPTPKSVDAEPGDWLDKLGNSLWSEVKGLIRIERIDTQPNLLLAPDQQFFLRENLKLRLLSARWSLQTRDTAGFRQEMDTAQTLLARFFATSNAQVQALRDDLKQIAATPLSTELPGLQDSISALRQAQQQAEKKVKP